MTSRVESTSSELVSIFHEQSGWNLARVKFFVLMISVEIPIKLGSSSHLGKIPLIEY